jgi:hypothetical protein
MRFEVFTVVKVYIDLGLYPEDSSRKFLQTI